MKVQNELKQALKQNFDYSESDADKVSKNVCKANPKAKLVELIRLSLNTEVEDIQTRTSGKTKDELRFYARKGLAAMDRLSAREIERVCALMIKMNKC